MRLLHALALLPPFLIPAAAGPEATSVRSAVEEQRQVLLQSSRGLEDTAGEKWSGRSARRRQTAYGRLHGLGVALSEPRAGQCATWTSQGSCGHPLFACAAEGETSWGGAPQSGGKAGWKILRVSSQRARSFFTSEEVENIKDLARPRLQEMGGAQGSLGNYGRWAARDAVAEIPLWEKSASPLDCRVVYADACAGVVGMACRVAREPGGRRTVIAEYYLTPAPDAGVDAAFEHP